ncbi:hypothetical protein D3C81_1702980 [compost metagenome]
MPAREKFQCQLTLAGAGFASDQHADGVDLHEYAVQGDARGERAGQVITEVVEQLVAALGRNPQRRLRFVGGGAQVFRAAMALGDDQRQRARLDDALDDFPALARIQ